MINKLSKQIYDNNRAKGFYNSEKNIGEMLALIHSEVSEALECDRKDEYYKLLLKKGGMTINDILKEKSDKLYTVDCEKYVKDTLKDERADIMIRVMDL